MRKLNYLFFKLAVLLTPIFARVEIFKQVSDYRLSLSTFGYNQGGSLYLKINLLRNDASLETGYPSIGFTLDRSMTLGDVEKNTQEQDLMDELMPINGFLPCILDDREAVVLQKLKDMDVKDSIDRITFKIDFGYGDQAEPLLFVWKTPTLKTGVEIYKSATVENSTDSEGLKSDWTSLTFKPMSPEILDTQRTPEEIQDLGYTVTSYPLTFASDGHGGENHRKIEIELRIDIIDKEQAGLYDLNFHSCYQKDQKRPEFNIRSEIIEMSTFCVGEDDLEDDCSLSAGDIPLPKIYRYTSLFSLFLTAIWFAQLQLGKANKQVEKLYLIHWLIAALFSLKSLGLINNYYKYRFISEYGTVLDCVIYGIQ